MSVKITIKNVIKKYDENVIIPGLSVEVKKGEFFTLLGPSGCGKTTLLRMIAGFNTIEGGQILFNEKIINDIPQHKRNIGMVFQNYAIFPHMTTAQNVAFGLDQRKINDDDKIKMVDEILEVVQIANLKNRKPKNMSGGQQQRIALARAIVIQPDVLLMDEPLSNLDAKLRIEMRTAIKRIQNKYKITTVYVTHDQNEALAISDRIGIMNKGVIQQIGTPIDIYSHPANLFCATFIGESNFLDATFIKNNEIKLFDGSKLIIDNLKDNLKPGQPLIVVVRPDEFTFSDKGLNGKIIDSSFLGNIIDYNVQLENKKEIKVSVASHLLLDIKQDEVKLEINKRIINVFDKETEISVMKTGK